MNIEEEENEIKDISFRDIFNVIWYYKWLIIIVTSATIAWSFRIFYYKPEIYSAETTIEINTNENRSSGDDILKEALKGGVSRDINTQMAILKSRFIILDAMKKVNLTTHIWGIGKWSKRFELYLYSPISVYIIKGKDLIFKLHNIDNSSYMLEVNVINSDGKSIIFKKEFQYGKLVKTDYFEIKISRTSANFQYKSYEFVDYNINNYAEVVRNNLIEVSQFADKVNMIRVVYRDTIPLRAKKFVNALTKTYMKQNIKLKTQDEEKTLTFIKQQLSIVKKNLKDSEREMEQFKSKIKIVDLSETTIDVSKSLSSLESQDNILEMQISMLNNIYNKIIEGYPLDTISVIGLDIDTSNINNLISKLQDLKLERDILEKELTDLHPKMIKLSRKIDSINRSIKIYIHNILNALVRKQLIISNNIEKKKKKLKELPAIQQNFLNLERRYKFNEKFYKYFLEKQAESNIKKVAKVNKNRIIDLSLLPKAPIEPNFVNSISIGAIIGLVIGILLSFILNIFRKPPIRNIEDIKEHSTVPILGTIPKLKKKETRNLIVLNNPRSFIAESFRTIATNIKFRKIDNNQKMVIVVTSTISGEGKSTISNNLAISLHNRTERVIILNFDLRKDSSKELGISDYIEKGFNLKDIIINTDIDNIDKILDGSNSHNPSELVNSNRVSILIDELKRYYDYIIIDTSPIGLVSEARVLSSYGDIVLYILRVGYSKKEFLKNINHLYQDRHIKDLAILLNCAKDKIGYGDGYYYGYDKKNNYYK